MTDPVNFANLFANPNFLLPPQPTPPAQWMHERLIRSLIEFEQKLDDSLEIGLRLVSFGNGDIIHISDVGYWGPDLVIFYGESAEGRAVELLQHITQ